MNIKSKIGATFFVTFILISSVCLGQNIPIANSYSGIIKIADSLFKGKEYLKAATKYSEAFEKNRNKGMVKDRYSSACCWALLGNSDSAFSQLYRIAVQGKYANHDEVSYETKFSSLHNDKRWEPLIAIMKKTKWEIENGINNN